jgi:hypothetical protein
LENLSTEEIRKNREKENLNEKKLNGNINLNINNYSLRYNDKDFNRIEILDNIELSENIKRDFIKKHFEYLDDLIRKEEDIPLRKKDIKNFKFDFKIKPDEIFVKIFSKNNYEYNQEYKQTMDLDSNTNTNTNSNTNSNSNSNIDNYLSNSNNINTNSNINNIDSKYNLNLNNSLSKFGNEHIDDEKIINKNDINLKAFLSTMNFVDSLCSISKDTFQIPKDEQIVFLKREISDLNKELPANVYIPFLNNSIRNHIVAHMPISELKIFRTKTRVLYMTVVEIIRIDEIIE